jgi:hypothetical protein
MHVGDVWGASSRERIRAFLGAAFESPRMFEIWEYTTSHAQRLLRSTKSDISPTRIDVLFKNVKVMNLVTGLDGLAIRQATEDERLRFANEAALHSDQPFWVVESTSFRGYVGASLMLTHEDDGEYNDPSALLPY